MSQLSEQNTEDDSVRLTYGRSEKLYCTTCYTVATKSLKGAFERDTGATKKQRINGCLLFLSAVSWEVYLGLHH